MNKLELNRKYQREWYNTKRKNNPEYRAKRKAYLKKWRETREAEYKEKNREKLRTYQREWKRQYKLKNPEKVREKRRERYLRERKENNPQRNLGMNIRIRIWCALYRNKSRKSKKMTKTEELIGITIPELKKYLESQFKPGMTWKNHGKWHIDHSQPLASFDLTKEEEQKKAFHYTNLQPLWAEENLSKGSKIS